MQMMSMHYNNIVCVIRLGIVEIWTAELDTPTLFSADLTGSHSSHVISFSELIEVACLNQLGHNIHITNCLYCVFKFVFMWATYENNARKYNYIIATSMFDQQ